MKPEEALTLEVPEELRQTARRVAALAPCYYGPIGHVVDGFQSALGNWKTELVHFLERYAFESTHSRHLKAPSVSVVQAIVKDRATPGGEFQKQVWDKFEEQWGGKNWSTRVNPLSLEPEERSVTHFIAMRVPDHKLQSWAVHMLAQERDIGKLHAQLKEIRGIGDKLASFYIRDLAHFVGFDEQSIDRELLHLFVPKDLWTERTAQVWWKTMDQAGSAIPIRTMYVTVAGAAGVRVRDLDAGSWVLGARLMGNRPLARLWNDPQELTDCLVQARDRYGDMRSELDEALEA